MKKHVIAAMITVGMLAGSQTLANSSNVQGSTVVQNEEQTSGSKRRTGRWITFSTLFKAKKTTIAVDPNAPVDEVVVKRARLFPLRKKQQPEVFTAIPSKDQLRALPMAQGNEEWQCLTEALYFEARGEKIPGIFAVAEVILNRRDSAKFPSTVCSVISQGAHRKNACQFSYKCDGHKEVYREQKAKALVAKIAQIVLEDRAPRLTKGATFYHANTVNPRWARSFRKTATIGKHYFYAG